MTSRLPFKDAQILAEDGKIAVWFGEPARILGGLDPSAALQVLDANERSRHAALRFEPDRLAYLAAHLLHRQVWAEAMSIAPNEVQISHDPSGRPSIVGRDGASYFTSLSRRRGMVAVAASQVGPVGVDVEETYSSAPRETELLSRFLTFASYASVCCEMETDDGAFGRVWTLIEAFAKARGHGLSDDLKDVTISALGGNRYEISDAQACCSALSLFPNPAHCTAVAWQRS